MREVVTEDLLPFSLQNRLAKHTEGMSFWSIDRELALAVHEEPIRLLFMREATKKAAATASALTETEQTYVANHKS